MIKAIIACDSEYGIGKNGTLPWPANKEDLRHFKNQTQGHIVVMGRKTWDDPCFPSPLKNRENYVISRTNKHLKGAEVITHNLIERILELDAKSDKDVWIIGGGSLITQCIDIIEEFRLTMIPGRFKCDVFLNFPFRKFDLPLLYKGEETNNVYYVYKKKVK